MDNDDAAQRWARVRFAVVGRLLVSPPGRGKLQEALCELSQQLWEHPRSGELTRFGVSTIERWYYRARGSNQPIAALRRRVRSDANLPQAIKDFYQMDAAEAEILLKHLARAGKGTFRAFSGWPAIDLSDIDFGPVPE